MKKYHSNNAIFNRKVYNDLEINFDTNYVEETLDSRLSIIKKKLYKFKNPYVGNKRKLICEIIKTIDKYGINYETVLDLFTGSGYVSIAMQLLGKNVICNDILVSSHFNTLATIINRSVELTKKEKDYLLNNNSKKPVNKFFENYQDRFTLKEIEFLNNYYYNIRYLFSPFASDGLTLIKTAISFASMQNYVLEHCFVGGRLSNNQVLAKVEHRMSHRKNNGREMPFKDIRWSKYSCTDESLRGKVFQMDAIDLLRERKELEIFPDMCYIDPPYGGLSSDYATMYEFVEGYVYLQTREEREEILDNYNDECILSINKRKESQQKFVSRTGYSENFDELISLTDGIPCIIISYNDSSWGSIEEISSIVKNHRKDVKIENFDYDYKYRNNNDKKQSKEFLIIGR